MSPALPRLPVLAALAGLQLVAAACESPARPRMRSAALPLPATTLPVLGPATTTTTSPRGAGASPTTSTTTAAAPTTTTTAPSSAPASGPAPGEGRVRPTRFGIGVQASADEAGLHGWMPETGVPWDYAYRYLGRDSTTMPVEYARAAAARGVTPVLTLYSLLAARGPCGSGCVEARRDLANLNDPPTMARYYADFASLMQRLGAGYGGDVIVHVEPDLSGYAQSATLEPTHCFGHCAGVGNDPSLLRASVAGSGFPDAAEFPDTYRGFNQVLLRLRDVWAPNVRLALHVSNWATGFDLSSATSRDLDPVALGTMAGEFAAASGASWTEGTTSTYDLLFNDVSNKDAAYYTYVLGKPRFWDQDNAVFPNFRRWEAYVKAVTTTTGLPAVVWQVPIGNQRALSMNNTPGHYQDNRVEYFFAHVHELRDAGLVGMLFGKTIDDATNFWDARDDDVTNPPPVCNRDGRSSGKLVCTTEVATVADDDGGYLRARAQAYARSPLAL